MPYYVQLTEPIPVGTHIKANDYWCITPEFIANLYEKFNITPIRNSYYGTIGEEKYADVFGLLALAFGFNPDDVERFMKLFWDDRYIDGFITGWDLEYVDEEEWGSESSHYGKGLRDAIAIRNHLTNLGFDIRRSQNAQVSQ